MKETPDDELRTETEIEALCDEFEQMLQSGESPSEQDDVLPDAIRPAVAEAFADPIEPKTSLENQRKWLPLLPANPLPANPLPRQWRLVIGFVISATTKSSMK